MRSFCFHAFPTRNQIDRKLSRVFPSLVSYLPKACTAPIPKDICICKTEADDTSAVELPRSAQARHIMSQRIRTLRLHDRIMISRGQDFKIQIFFFLF
jgi:hypothetical protein